MILEHLVDEVIQSAFDNSAGTLLNENAINSVLNSLIKSRNLNKDNIDLLIAENESNSGYMIKYSDFIYVLKDYITENDIQENLEFEKSEKDLEIVELIYGDWHSECGAR